VHRKNKEAPSYGLTTYWQALEENMNKLMSVSEVCDHLGISRDTFDKWRARGVAPHATRMPNGQLRISAQDLDAWMHSLETV
jgi:excisionase family DNA binding protein